jgi:hypothetical protein
MRLAARLILTAACAGVACGLAGCGDGRPGVYPARGKVTDAAGKPLAGATVILHPAGGADAKVPKPAGLADQDGAFVLATYSHNDGAPAGDYVATVEWRAAPKSPADDSPGASPPPTPSRSFTAT